PRSSGRPYVISIHLPPSYCCRPSVNAGRSPFVHLPRTCACADPSGLMGRLACWASSSALARRNVLTAAILCFIDPPELPGWSSPTVLLARRDCLSRLLTRHRY